MSFKHRLRHGQTKLKNIAALRTQLEANILAEILKFETDASMDIDTIHILRAEPDPQEVVEVEVELKQIPRNFW